MAKNKPDLEALVRSYQQGPRCRKASWWSFAWRSLLVWQILLTCLGIKPLQQCLTLLPPLWKPSFFYGAYGLMFIMIAMLGFRKTYRPLFSTKIDINRRVWRKHNLMLAIGSAALSGVNAIASTKLPIEEWVIVKISLLPIFFIMILAVSFKSSRQ